MALSSFVRRASSSVNTSIRSRRCYQNQISLLNIENSFSVGGQFLPFETSGNSPVHGFVRRAYSSIAPLSIRSLGSRRPYQTQISPLGGQFLSLIESNNNIRDSSKDDGLDGLDFDIIAGGLEEGYLTLAKKSADEIIEVKVRPYYQLMYAGFSSPEGIPALRHLYMLVKIYTGDQFSKCQKFFIFAYPDSINIRIVTMSGVEPGAKVHLEECEEYFEEKGITPSNTNWLFDYLKNYKETNISSLPRISPTHQHYPTIHHYPTLVRPNYD